MLNAETDALVVAPAMLYDHASIERALRHRAHALFIDRAAVDGWKVEAYARWDSAHPHLAGHFPDMPVVPGVFLIEGAAQAAGLVLASALAGSSADDTMPVLAGVRSCKFHEMVRPGDIIRFELDVEPVVPGKYFEASGAGYFIDGKKVINLQLNVATVLLADAAAGSRMARTGSADCD